MHLRFLPISNLAAVKGKVAAGILVLAIPGIARATDMDPARAAELQAFNRQLLLEPSATAVLGSWCASHHLATEPKIAALKVATPDKRPDRETLQLLGAREGQVRYRHVSLACGGRTLSEADNWYRPDRLTAAMNTTLATTTVPFGVVVKPLRFRRRTLSVSFPISDPGCVLRHRAVLTTAAGRSFSVVVESYTPEVLGDPRPSR